MDQTIQSGESGLLRECIPAAAQGSFNAVTSAARLSGSFGALDLDRTTVIR